MAAVPERPLDATIVSECHRLYAGVLERYAWAIVRDWSSAADVVQNSFLSLSRFGGDVAPEARKNWLFRVVHREAIKLREQQKRFQASDVVPMDSVSEPKGTYEVNPLSKMADRETVELLRKQIQSLPTEQQQTLQLRIFEDKSFAEIAEVMQVPIGTALSRMRLALERLRRHT